MFWLAEPKLILELICLIVPSIPYKLNETVSFKFVPLVFSKDNIACVEELASTDVSSFTLLILLAITSAISPLFTFICFLPRVPNMLTSCPVFMIFSVKDADAPTDRLPFELTSTSPYRNEPMLSITEPLNFLAAFVTATSSINN